MNSTGWVATIVVIILIIAGAWWYTQQPTSTNNTVNVNQNATTTEEVATTTTEASSTVSVPKTVTVSYTSSGFSPKTVTINKGDTINFVNNSSGAMWVASAVHPTHEVYDGTTRTTHCAAGYTPKPFDQCATGSSFSFTFDKVGTFNYHNHSSAQSTGTVTVQ